MRLARDNHKAAPRKLGRLSQTTPTRVVSLVTTPTVRSLMPLVVNVKRFPRTHTPTPTLGAPVVHDPNFSRRLSGRRRPLVVLHQRGIDAGARYPPVCVALVDELTAVGGLEFDDRPRHRAQRAGRRKPSRSKSRAGNLGTPSLREPKMAAKHGRGTHPVILVVALPSETRRAVSMLYCLTSVPAHVCVCVSRRERTRPAQ